MKIQQILGSKHEFSMFVPSVELCVKDVTQVPIVPGWEGG